MFGEFGSALFIAPPVTATVAPLPSVKPKVELSTEVGPVLKVTGKVLVAYNCVALVAPIENPVLPLAMVLPNLW